MRLNRRTSAAAALLLAAGCESGGTQAGSIPVSTLFPIEEGRFSSYRLLSADEYAASDPTADVLDTEDLLSARLTAGGCEGGWRLELRTGGAWESAEPAGALHFAADAGLAVCAVEEPDGALSVLDPPAALWTDAPLRDGENVVSGDWTVTPTEVEGRVTYFGVFPSAVAFSFAGEGTPAGWTLSMAPGFGVILFETEDFTADLVYTR